jgi:hypothetical protein
MAFPDIQNIPEINQHGNANGKYRQDTVDLGCPGESHKCSRQKKPCPPLAGKLPRKWLL